MCWDYCTINESELSTFGAYGWEAYAVRVAKDGTVLYFMKRRRVGDDDDA
jgi:hypothetical protein